jgi:undecaprenyl phosphate N,N'-diacetylbacillosamine 1-phosphate transferase
MSQKLNNTKNSFYRLIGKRLFDISVSSVGLIFALPIMLATAIALYFTNDKKVFFFQLRPGKNGKIFKIAKFKSMRDTRDEKGELLPDEERLFGVGKIVRKLSLDELPQLVNVLKGEMSLIGPRPLLVDYLPLYSTHQARRHDVTPGITGLAQVNGRNCLNWERRFRYDVFYVENLSFKLDMYILYKTFEQVFKTEDVNFEQPVELSRFMGTPARKGKKLQAILAKKASVSLNGVHANSIDTDELASQAQNL